MSPAGTPPDRCPSAVLRAHVLLVAAIFVPYMVLMTGLGAYMWGQVRRHLRDEEPPDSSDEDGPGDVLLAA